MFEEHQEVHSRKSFKNGDGSGTFLGGAGSEQEGNQQNGDTTRGLKQMRGSFSCLHPISPAASETNNIFCAASI